MNPRYLDRVQRGKAKLDGYPVPPDPPAVLKITPNWDELTPPRRGFSFHPGTRPMNVTALVALRFYANRLCTVTEPATQKPIATLAIGGLINATLLTRRRSPQTLLSVSYTR